MSPADNINMFTLQAQWGDQHRQNLLQALQQGAGVLKDLQYAVGDTQFMTFSSQGGVGALQAIQAGNQLTMRVNDDLQRLNTQVATFNGVVLEKMAREQSENDARSDPPAIACTRPRSIHTTARARSTLLIVDCTR